MLQLATTKRAVLEAGGNLIARQGYPGTTVEQIAAEASVKTEGQGSGVSRPIQRRLQMRR